MTEQQQDLLLFQLEKQTPIGQSRYKPARSRVTPYWREAGKL